MIDIKDYEIFTRNLNSLEKLSYDNFSNEYMTNSSKLAVDFDSVKNEYAKPLIRKLPFPRSFDALLTSNNCIYFIEFKNGSLMNPKYKDENIIKIHQKIRDSLLIYLDIVKLTVEDTRKNVEFILVYNETKNPSLHSIKSHFLGKANKETIYFSLEKFQNLYFRKVHTYTKTEFEKLLSKLQ